MQIDCKVELIEKYVCQKNLSSYDPYDIWKTRLGKYFKKLYYKNKYVGVIPSAALTLFDFYFNNRARLFYQKQEFPIVRAQASLSLLNIYQKNLTKKYLTYAKEHIDWLLENYSKNYYGYCWGLNFEWVYSGNETYKSDTPFSTHTPYPLEALITYYNLTKDESYVKPIKSILAFIEKDLQIMFEDENKLVISYSAQKDRIVTNANSYVMYMYAMLLPFFPEKREIIENKIHKIYAFLTSVQNDDGSWLYSPYDEGGFIDCFHSCFVVKNIYKTNLIVNLESSDKVINKGYNYLIKHFFDKDYSLFKRFVKKNKPSLVKFDLYDNAEMLNLANLLNDGKITKELCLAVERNFVKKNNIYSTIDLFGLKKNSNQLRWAVLPYLLALSNLKQI